MNNVLSKMIYCALIVSVIAAIFAIPAVLIALVSSFIAWISGWQFGWIFSIGITVNFLVAAHILDDLYTQMQNFKIDLDFKDEEDEDLL